MTTEIKNNVIGNLAFSRQGLRKFPGQTSPLGLSSSWRIKTAYFTDSIKQQLQ